MLRGGLSLGAVSTPCSGSVSASREAGVRALCLSLGFPLVPYPVAHAPGYARGEGHSENVRTKAFRIVSAIVLAFWASAAISSRGFLLVARALSSWLALSPR
jgi:hypothetical protein